MTAVHCSRCKTDVLHKSKNVYYITNNNNYLNWVGFQAVLKFGQLWFLFVGVYKCAMKQVGSSKWAEI